MLKIHMLITKKLNRNGTENDKYIYLKGTLIFEGLIYFQFLCFHFTNDLLHN